uniref:Nuclear protein n=1 Tax=Soybean cyst nematode associated northern cereal mosaic virus TaxID=1034378 RepID=G0WXQ4_9RHAB|nr:hypothetical protein [Soybean cyst nematode associated northern cereal mosaic virus]
MFQNAAVAKGFLNARLPAKKKTEKDDPKAPTGSISKPMRQPTPYANFALQLDCRYRIISREAHNAVSWEITAAEVLNGIARTGPIAVLRQVALAVGLTKASLTHPLGIAPPFNRMCLGYDVVNLVVKGALAIEDIKWSGRDVGEVTGVISTQGVSSISVVARIVFVGSSTPEGTIIPWASVKQTIKAGHKAGSIREVKKAFGLE